MYGEKTEENEELKMDLQDVKDMYKLQVKQFFLIQKIVKTGTLINCKYKI